MEKVFAKIKCYTVNLGGLVQLEESNTFPFPKNMCYFGSQQLGAGNRNMLLDIHKNVYVPYIQTDHPAKCRVFIRLNNLQSLNSVSEIEHVECLFLKSKGKSFSFLKYYISLYDV